MRARKLRIEQLIKRAISTILMSEINIQSHIDFFPSISRVELSKDLSHAKIFLLFDENKKSKSDRLMKFLKNNIHSIRKSLAFHANLKYIPKIEFKLDQQLVYLQKLYDQIDQTQST